MWHFAFSSLYFCHSSYFLFVICFIDCLLEKLFSLHLKGEKQLQRIRIFFNDGCADIANNKHSIISSQLLVVGPAAPNGLDPKLLIHILSCRFTRFFELGGSFTTWEKIVCGLIEYPCCVIMIASAEKCFFSDCEGNTFDFSLMKQAVPVF